LYSNGGNLMIETETMSLFDFLFPEQAQASYLRQMASSNAQQVAMLRSQQYAEELRKKQAVRLNSKAEDRVKELELELAQSALVIESLISLLEEKNLVTRQELKQRTSQIDAADGVIDGRITPPEDRPFVPKRDWPG
jgi:regulator of protease activity HflC (stomatin/prohibitin superfamily)